MDLGSSLCTPRSPQCLLCPLRFACIAHRQGRAEAYPIKPPKQEKPHRHGTVWWLERADGHVWIERRADKRMLGGMAGLPDSGWDKGIDRDAGPLAGNWVALNRPVIHVFTHFRLTLSVERLRVPVEAAPGGSGQWWPRETIGEAGLPSLFAKVARAVMKAGYD